MKVKIRKLLFLLLASVSVTIIVSLISAPISVLAAPISVLQFGSAGSGNGEFDSSPTDVAIDVSGNIYVVDSGNARIQKFDSDGVYVSQFGTGGSGNGEFNGARSIAIDSSGNIFVLDYGNSRIQKFDSSGAYVSQFGSFGTGNGQFGSNLYEFAIDSSDNIYVVDSANSRVQKFDSSGVYVLQFGTSGSGNGQLTNPTGIAIDSSGNVYVVDLSNNRVQKFDSSGTYLSKFTISTGVGFAAAIDSSGNIYISNFDDNILKYNSSGVFVSQIGSSGASNGLFDAPWGIAIDSAGSIYVADKNNLRVQKFSDTAPTVSAPTSNAVVSVGTAITGTCVTGSTVTALVDSVVISPTASCTSSAYSITPSTPLSVGVHTVLVRQADAGGNVSTTSSSTSFYISAFTAVDCTDSADLTALGGGVTPIPQSECEFLADLYTLTNGSSWTDDTNWNTVSDVGTWYGITRASTHVTVVNLQSNNLVGTLPTSVSNISNVITLNFENNTLSGSVPNISSLTSLAALILSSNDFTGSIPSLSANTSLININLSDNLLSGTIPSLSSNTALQIFNINKNSITGSIPSLSSNTSLTDFNVSKNQLSGSIPSITANTSLATFHLNQNKLTGDIPDMTPYSITLGSFAENGLSTSSSTKDSAADSKFSEDWSSTQTIAPTNVIATQSGSNIVVTWDPVEYTSVGSYKVYYGTSQGGPYSTLAGTVARTASPTLTVSGLTSNTNYYFIVQAYTPANGTQQNIITADSAEALGRVVVSGGGSSSSGGSRSGSSSGGGFHKYPTSADSSRMTLSLANVPNLIDHIAKFRWSPIVNAATMTFSLDSKFTNAISIPFKQDTDFILPGAVGVYNVYAKLTSSTGDVVSFVPVSVKIENSKNTKPLTPKVVNKKPIASPIKAPLTCGPLKKYLEPGRVNNDKNEVKLWQNFLNKYEGEELEVNGNYDLLTQEAVFRYQAVNDMKVDGIIGSATRLPANKILGCK